jgi:hypothetical protein
VSDRAVRIIIVCVAILLIISLIFPYERFNIAIKYSTIIKIIMGAVAIGVGIRLAFALR